jgi:hypothetical protein
VPDPAPRWPVVDADQPNFLPVEGHDVVACAAGMPVPRTITLTEDTDGSGGASEEFQTVLRLGMARCVLCFPIIPGVCRGCGCTDDHACPDGCWWVDGEEDLCSVCHDMEPEELGGVRTT